MYTVPSDISREQLKTILPGDIEKLKLSPKEIRDMEFCNLGVEQLVGYYYDKNGNIYFEPGLQFTLKISCFKKLFSKKP
jgi:hypothetical protein